MEQATPSPVDGNLFRLVIRRPDKPDRECSLAHGVYPIGSDEANLIVLPGADVAWRHAVLSIFPDGTWIEDFNSPTGTLLDDRRLEGRQKVLPNQVVRIGTCELVLTVPSPASPPPPPSVEAEADGFLVLPELSDAERLAEDRAFLQKKRIIKQQIQNELHKRLDITRLTAKHIEEAELHQRVRSTLEHVVAEAAANLPDEFTQEDVIKEVYDEAVGLGPLEDLLDDPTITEVMVNGPSDIYVEREGKLQLTEKTFVDADSVLAIIERIVAPIGRRIDESQPYVDARLPDGSRVNAIISPLSLTGPCLTIRKFSRDPFTVDDMIGFGTLTRDLAEFIEASVVLRKNIIVSGGTGSGKTTLLNVISSYLPAHERIVTIEDAAELRMTQNHVVRLEARPPNIEGRGAITIRDLVRNALRMRPDRIVVGECRGGEALDMLQAMNTGHEGSLTTVHANSPRDVISRLETMVLMSGMDIPVRAIREQVGSAVHLIVHTSRFMDGSRKVARITEVVGLEGDRVTMQDIFEFQQTGLDETGRVRGSFVATGSVPTYVEEMKARGISLRQEIFDPQVRHDG